MERIDDKIEEIKKYLDELEKFTPSSLEEYKDKVEKKRICERYFEIIVEALVDLAYLTINENKFKSPENDEQAFDILKENKVISNELAEKLKSAKGMRNIIAHEYGKVDDELVFGAVKNELIMDSGEFIKLVGIGEK